MSNNEPGRSRPTLEEQEQFWKQQLTDLPLLELPLDYPRSGFRSFIRERQSIVFDDETSNRIRKFCETEGLSVFTVLCGALIAVLGRHTGQTDIILGTVSPDCIDSKGEVFANPLTLRVDVGDNPTGHQFLQRVAETAISAACNRDYRFEELESILGDYQNFDRTPLFQIAFALCGEENSGPWGKSLYQNDLDMVAEHTARCDILLVASEHDGNWSIEADFDTDVLEANSVARFFGHIKILTTALITEPDQELSGFPLISEEEQQQLLVEWNATSVDYPRHHTLHELFEAQVARTPESPALFYDDEVFTYSDLNLHANQLARSLQKLGVGPEVFVGVYMERSVEMVVALYAILKAGGAFVPLDPEYPLDRVGFMLDDAQVPVLLIQEHLRERCPESQARILCVDINQTVGEFDSAANLDSGAKADNLAYVIFTSGSTGRPKGVMIDHRAICNRLLWMQDTYQLDNSDRVVQKTPFSFDVSVWEFFWPLQVGAALVIAQPGAHRDNAYIIKLIKQQAITTLHFVPSMLRLFVEEPGLGECTSLKRVICSGEALPIELQQLFFERVEAELHNLYGPTEAAVDVTYWQCGQDSELHVVPIGRPIANTQIYVLDQNLRPVPIRAPGELYIGGVQVARGYLNQPELTAEKFIPDPFSSEPGARLYKTGDLACVLPNGIFEYLGRIDYQVKLRGFRIELGEIETQLCEHPDVSESVVLLREDNPEDKRLVGYIVPKGKEAPDYSELQNFLKNKLPDFMIPDQIVSLDAIPLSPSGKADRKALPEPSIQKPGTLGNNDISPQSDLEQIVKDVWCEVLNHEDVGTRDNFFDLGGHSLLVAACRIKLQEKLGLELSMTELFRYPTVEALSTHLSGQLCDAPAINMGGYAQKRKTSTDNPDIAIIGMACRLPGAEDVDEFWQNLKEGVESVTFFTDEELRTAGVDPVKITDSNYIKARAILAGADEFDAAFFGYSPREAELMDPQQRVFLECAWHALENSGYDPGSYQDPIGVYAGEGMNTYLLNNLYEEDSASGSVGAFQVMIGNDKDFLATRVSYKLDLTGPAINVQTACSTSLVATHLACQSLISGECDMVLVGGSSIHFPQISGYEYQEGMILSSDGHCRAFDSKADGTVFGNGVAAVVLKCLDAAIADGDHIHAVIKGSAINNDGGFKIGYTAPSVEGQAAVISRAHAEARVDPGSISYVETHGTGTALGDPIEIEALSQAFNTDTVKKSGCGIGSVKTNIGHVDAAAGVTGLIKTALALEHRVLPPSLHFQEPNPQIDFSESPFYVVTKPTEWQSNGQPRRAGVSSFGIGGTNAHAILEEAPERKRDESNLERSSQILCLSAKSESALKALAGRYDAYFKTHPESVIGDVCFTANAGRAHFGHRLVVVGDTVATLRTGLEDYVVRGTGSSVQQNEAKLGESLKVAFLFTGQGSQWVGMGRELYETQASFRRDLEHCEEVLQEYMDRPLLEVMFGNKQGEEEKLLDETGYTQPALFALEYSLAQLWRSWGIEPAVVMGHSVGEYVAACLAGVFTLEDGLKLVAERGRLMQSLPHEGEMVAVRREEKQVSEIVAPYASEVSLAAVNGPTSVVISGQREAIREIVEKLESADMEVRPLQVSHAFHSPLMEPMLKAFEEVARTVHYSPPRIAMVSNVTGKMAGEEVTCSQYWVDHVRQTVQFASGMETLHSNGYKVYLEVGPQPTLLGMGRQCVPEDRGEWLPSMRKGRPDWNQMLTTLGALYVRGASIDWPGYERDYQHYRLPLPTYPFQRKSYWLDGLQSKQDESTHRVIDDSKLPFPDEWLVKLGWEQTEFHNLPTSTRTDERKRWLIFADNDGLGATLSKRLQDSDNSCCIVSIGENYEQINEDEFRLNASNPEHYRRLLRDAMKDSEHPFDGLVHLWSLNDGAGHSEPSTDVAMTLTRGCHSIVYLIQALSNVQLGKTARLTLVTRGCQAVVSTGVTDPLQAMLWGLGRTVALEQPELNCLQIDLSPNGMHEDETEALLTELYAEEHMETQVTYHEGARYCARLSRFHRQSNYVNSTDKDVKTAVFSEVTSGVKIRSEVSYLITGGLGGLGFKVAEWLVQKGARYLVLVGRKGVTKSIQSVLDEWEIAGVKILIIAADVSKSDDAHTLLAQIQQQMPPLGGIFHAAGTLEPAMVVDQDKLKFDRVLAPKVLGAWNLHCLTKDCPLDMFVMFSSVASLLGTRGQCNYAAANAFLDSLALYRHSLGLSGLAINWGPWSETGMASRATMKEQEQLHALGWTYINPNRGMEIFEAIMQEPVASCVVAPLDWNAFVRQFQGSNIPSLFKDLLSEQQGLDESGRGKFEPDLHIKQRLFGISSEDRKAMLESYLRQRLVTILGHVSDTDLRFDQSLTELGLDSLMQTELRGLLNKDLEINVPLVEFIKASSIPDLAQALTNHLALDQMLKPSNDINGDETEELSI